MALSVPAAPLAERRASRLLSEAVSLIDPEARLRRLLAAKPEQHPRYAAEQERAVALAKLRRADERCLVLGSSSVLPPADPAAVTKVAVGQIVTPGSSPPAAATIARGAMPALPVRGGGGGGRGGGSGSGGGRGGGSGSGGGRGVARASPRPPVAHPPPLAAPLRRRPEVRTSTRPAPTPRLPPPPPSQPLSARRTGTGAGAAAGGGPARARRPELPRPKPPRPERPERRGGGAPAARGAAAAKGAAVAQGAARHVESTLQDGWRQVECHAPSTTLHHPAPRCTTRRHPAPSCTTLHRRRPPAARPPHARRTPLYRWSLPTVACDSSTKREARPGAAVTPRAAASSTSIS